MFFLFFFLFIIALDFEEKNRFSENRFWKKNNLDFKKLIFELENIL